MVFVKLLSYQGNLMNNLQDLSVDLKVADKVNFMDRIPAEQMPQVYRSNDIFLMSSAHEGMSNAMLEAMASGLPIVTARCEGVEELIAGNGIVIEQPSPQTFAVAIEKLTNNPELCRNMSIAAQKQAQKFTWLSVAQQYLDTYYAITKNKCK